MKIFVTLLLAFISLVTYSQKATSRLYDGGGEYKPQPWTFSSTYRPSYVFLFDQGKMVRPEEVAPYIDSIKQENEELKLMLKEARYEVNVWRDAYQLQQQRRLRQIKAIEAELKTGK